VLIDEIDKRLEEIEKNNPGAVLKLVNAG